MKSASAIPRRVAFKCGRSLSNQEDLMQKMQARRRPCLTPAVVASAILSGGKRRIARLQHGDSREFQQKIDLWSIELTLLRRDIDAHAPATEFAGTIVWTALFVRLTAMIATFDCWRRRRGNRSIAWPETRHTKPATAKHAVSDESRRRHDSQDWAEHRHERSVPRPSFSLVEW
jgi:hypothetical protein